MTDIDRLIGFMAIMQVPFMNDPDALAYIEEVKTVLKQAKARESGWISVEDRLPEIDERVLVFGVGKYDCFIGTTQIAITHMSDRNLIDCNRKTEPYWVAPWQYFLTDYEIIHWMPLPEPPKADHNAADRR